MSFDFTTPKYLVPAQRKNKQHKPSAQRKGKGKKGTGRGKGGGSDLLSFATGVSVPMRPLFPMRSKVLRLNYQENVSVTTGASSVGNYVFAANGLYDPNITGTGHQPLGFDQMMLVYNHYCVVRSRIIVTARNASSTLGAYIAVSQHAGTTPLTVDSRLIESGLIKYSYLSPKSSMGYTKILSERMDIAKFTGVDDALDVIELRGSVGANPAEGQYFDISAWNPDDATQVPIYLEVLIEFDAIFTEPQEITQSLTRPIPQSMGSTLVDRSLRFCKSARSTDDPARRA